MQKRGTFLNTKRSDNNVDGLSDRYGVPAKQAVVPGALHGDIPAKHVSILKLLERGLCRIKISGLANTLQDFRQSSHFSSASS